MKRRNFLRSLGCAVAIGMAPMAFNRTKLELAKPKPEGVPTVDFYKSYHGYRFPMLIQGRGVLQIKTPDGAWVNCYDDNGIIELTEERPAEFIIHRGEFRLLQA